MEQIRNLFQKDLKHHAYIFVGSLTTILPELKRHLEESSGRPLGQNPDIYFKSFNTFGIENSRYLRRRGQQKSFAGQKKYFVVAVDFITTEAQNALLKIFEEPPADNHFFLVARHQAVFLPTLCSRCQIISCFETSAKGGTDQLVVDGRAKEFLSSHITERLGLIEVWVDEKESLKSDTLRFLDELEVLVYNQKKPRQILEKIITGRRFLTQPGAYPKLILTDIALALD